MVFLYKAVRGVCTDSFGTHCAVAADMPAEVIERARNISRCRLEGRPIERVDFDEAGAAAKELLLTTLVDRFLAYDLAGHSASSFLERIDELQLAH